MVMARLALLSTASVLLAGCLPEIVQAPDAPDAADTADTADTGQTQSPQTPQTPVGAPPTREEAARFLVQASFGPNEDDIAEVVSLGFPGWIDHQAKLPPPSMTQRILQTPDAVRATLKDLFWGHAIDGEDQLRQRVAYALSQIVVVGLRAEFVHGQPETYATYMDILQRGALGNYQDVIREVSLNPAMGIYLSSLGNSKADAGKGFAPDENYARELMQLFTIGLEELNSDGTPTGRETYTTEDIKGLAQVFTGLSWNDASFRWPDRRRYDPTAPMVSHDAYHEAAPKTFLGATIDVGSNAEASVAAALDHLLAHPNLAPFVGKRLIQNLVTANPTPAYVARVSAAFEAGSLTKDGYTFGTGRRGDMAATVAAILLDEEARSTTRAGHPEHGKVREPAMRAAQFLRAFRDDASVPMSGAPSSAGRLRSADYSWTLNQQPYNPASVFGFARPGYVAPNGWTADRGMVAPNLSLAGGALTTSYINFMGYLVGEPDDSIPNFLVDYAAFMPLTADPAALVDRLDELLTYGSLTAQTRDRIVEALEAVTVDDRNTEQDKRHRMRLAVLMMVTSPEYGVLR